MGSSTTIRSGSATVTVSGVDEVTRAATRALIAGVREELRVRLGRVLDRARERWPVRTGRSRDGLGLETVEVEGQEVTTRLRNGAWYAGDIRQRRHPLPTWDELVVQPATEAAQDAEQAMRSSLPRAVQTAVDGA